MSSLLFALLVGAAPALADDINVLVNDHGDPIWLLEPVPGHWTEHKGIGNPTVVYDPVAAEYVMYFESRIYDDLLFNGPNDSPPGLGLDPRDYDDCRLGRNPDKPAVVWAIGRATSPDGFAWTMGPWPVILPEPGTWYACQAAQPAAVYEKEDHWHIYFKALQWNPNNQSPDRASPCGDGRPVPEWGCARVTGFGHADSKDGRSFEVSDDLVLPSAVAMAGTGANPSQLGFPRVSALSGDWYLWYTAVPSVYQATSAKPADEFEPDPTPITDYPGDGTGRVTTGAVFCRNGVPPAAMLDGRWGDTNVECGMTVAATSDLEHWTRQSDEPVLTWDCTSGWDRWDVIDMQDDIVLWYAASGSADPNAPSRIGFASTVRLATEPPYATLDPTKFGNKVCKKAPVKSTSLVGWTTELVEVTPSAVPEPPGATSGSCDTGRSSGAVSLPWLALAVVARRRATPRPTG